MTIAKANCCKPQVPQVISKVVKMTTRTNSLTKSLFRIIIIMIGVTTVQVGESAELNNDLHQELYGQASESNNHNMPGHYEFEIAPRMEPPSVKKPPYDLSSTTCSGLDPFNAFSARDTLCGDLNKGMIPRNPLQQLFDGHPYPFELIKNKTLHFLAKALPILKSEYETIPKVARFVPANQLLNPTFESSPLLAEHLHHLNSHPTLGLTAELANSVAPPFVRRKRSLSIRQQTGTSAVVAKQTQSDELMNATVVRTAHGARLHHAPINGETVTSKPVESPVLGVIGGGGGGGGPFSSASLTRPTKQTRDSQQQQSTPRSDPKPSKKPASDETLAGRSSGDSSLSSSSSSLSSSPSTQAAEQPQQPTKTPTISNNYNNKHQAAAGKRCGDLGGFSAVVCQAAASLIEGEKATGWVQVAKMLGAIHANAADSAANAPLWSALVGLTPEPSAVNGKGGSQSILNYFWPLSALLSSSSSSSTSSTASPPIDKRSDAAQSATPTENNAAKKTTPPKALSSLAAPFAAGLASSALASLVEYAFPSMSFRRSSTGGSGNFARRKTSETFTDIPAPLSASAPQRLQPLQTASSSSSLATSSSILKQPPTPCQSSEEYISPTFARNYQGAWKYVVQIPHEGYFTQTIQRTSCVKQKCDYMDGVCHESPRWVSLLVAEIFYPNAVFSQSPGLGQAPFVAMHGPIASGANQQPQWPSQAGQQQPFAMTSASSTSSLHQYPATVFGVGAFQPQQQQSNKPQANNGRQPNVADPLQMTDSLQNYNYQLNSAFAQAATELGLDPSNVENMQQLANAYEFQLLQRNGIVPNAQQRIALTTAQQHQPANKPIQDKQQAAKANWVWQNQQQQPTQVQQAAASSNQAAYASSANDHLTNFVASALLQQNPQLSINDILSALQSATSKRRKKRDAHSQLRRGDTLIQSANDLSSLPPQLDTSGLATFKASAQSAANQPTGGSAISSSASAGSGQATGMQQSGGGGGASGGSQQAATTQSANNAATNSANDQTECDGHDKMGCYVVRVYYDWFLVNGSCKCWKTSTSNSNASNSLLRRIFTTG